MISYTMIPFAIKYNVFQFKMISIKFGGNIHVNCDSAIKFIELVDF
jgi:hypothetical protein